MIIFSFEKKIKCRLFLREISRPSKEYGIDFILYTVQVERLTLWLYCSLKDF